MELNAYRVMWIFVFFDLPTETKKNRKNAAFFRKNLIKDGFNMMQYSVYNRHCASSESADAHQKRIIKIVPPKGKVSVLRITDKQYSKIINFWGQDIQSKNPPPLQLELF